MTLRIGHINVAGPIHHHVPRLGAAGVELLDAVVVKVGHVDIARAVHGYALGIGELAVAGARGAEFQEEDVGRVELPSALQRNI